MISDEFGLEILRALAKAGPFGLGLHELACAVWPDRERDNRQHSVLGAALSELETSGLVLCSGGSSKRARYALTSAGERRLAGYRVGAPVARPAVPPPPPQANPLDRIEAAIRSVACWPKVPEWMPGPQADRLYAEHMRRVRDVLDEACGDDDGLFDAALVEALRRLDRNIYYLIEGQSAGPLSPAQEQYLEYQRRSA